jgi:homoserine O-succinyltransferase/O-acetyltransferase
MPMIAINPPPLPTPHIRHVPKVTVAFVNNTSDRALATTEAQFLALLRSSASGIDLRVKFFTCPNIVRETVPCTSIGHAYADIASLFESHVDALVVTGMEPTTRRLPNEPVWQPLTRLIDWADRKGIPSIWSCLAAHAAVLWLDGIERTPHPAKVSDILRCELITRTHPLMRGLPPEWWTPHSRYYGLPETALAAGGYHVLSRTVGAGADVFVRNARSSFVFLQGHPEYEQDSLLREYRRDLRRYFCGKREDYPTAPISYFRPETGFLLAQIRRQALRDPRRARADGKMLDRVLALAKCGKAPVRWDNVASTIYENWMGAFVLDRRHFDACAPPIVEPNTASLRNSTPELLFGK